MFASIQQPSRPSPRHPAASQRPVGPAVIKAVGLGGAGSNAINRMIELGITGVDFIAANTDAQALRNSLAPTTIQLGPRLTRGLGAGGDPSVGQSAAAESKAEIAEALAGADMVFLAAGMGGGTGTGAISVVAQTARAQGAVTIAVVTTPFAFEMSRRARAAQFGIDALRPHTDTLIVVPNDRLINLVPKHVSLDVAFRVADEVLRQGVQGIAELITRPGFINVDFAHVRHLMQLAGGAFLAIGQGHGPNKAMDAALQALHHPLLDSESVQAAAGILVHFTGGDDLGLHEVHEAIESITQVASPDAEIVFGATLDPTMTDRAQVILVATGVGGHSLTDVMQQTGRPQSTPSSVDTEREPLMANPMADWVVADPVRGVDLDNLDLPAFLRKRRAH